MLTRRHKLTYVVSAFGTISVIQFARLILGVFLLLGRLWFFIATS